MDKNQPPIYELIMLEKPITINDSGWPEYGHMESVGYYYEEETALKAVRQNWCDINDGGCYNAALIQKKYPGLYPIPSQEWYFVFDYDNLVYTETQIPKELKHFVL